MRPIRFPWGRKARARQRALAAARDWQEFERRAAYARIAGLAAAMPERDCPTAGGPIRRGSITPDRAGPPAR